MLSLCIYQGFHDIQMLLVGWGRICDDTELMEHLRSLDMKDLTDVPSFVTSVYIKKPFDPKREIVPDGCEEFTNMMAAYAFFARVEWARWCEGLGTDARSQLKMLRRARIGAYCFGETLGGTKMMDWK